jgi:uncharacterized membrane protein
MRQDVLIVGIILIAVGLIMWFIGGNAYNNAYQNYQIASALEPLGYNPSIYKTAMSFWSIFSIVGFLLFIFAIPVSLVGATFKEEKKTKFQQPYLTEPQTYNQPQSFQQQQSIQQQSILKESFCPNCGVKLEGAPIFCFNCGFKLR